MKYIYFTLYIFSALFTITSFTFAYSSTTSPSNHAGGNGNFGLVGFLLFSPIIIIFIAMSISYFHQYLYKKYERDTIRLMTISSLLINLIILSMTVIRAFRLKTILAKVNPIYKGQAEIPLFTPYSNAIFFNLFTFISLLLICSFAHLLVA